MNRDITPWPESLASQYESAGYWQALSLTDHLQMWARQYGQKTALVDVNGRLSYTDLYNESQQLAVALSALGLRQGDRVLVQLPNRLEFVLACFAMFRIGVIPIFALPASKDADLDAFCTLAQPCAIVSQCWMNGTDRTQMLLSLPARHACLKQLLLLDATGLPTRINQASILSWSQLDGESRALPEPPNYRDVALMLLSGGTTGTPKLIPRTHCDYALNFTEAAKRSGFNADTVYLACLPISHNFAFGSPGVLGTLSVGGCAVLSASPTCDDAFRWIESQAVTTTSLVPTLVRHWLDALAWENANLSSLTLIQVGGAYLDPALAKKITPAFNCYLQQVFGMAEGLLCFTGLADEPFLIHHTQGTPLLSADELQVVDTHGQPVKVGEEGELWVRGPYTIRGYYRGEAHNQASFTEDGFYRTGDKVVLDKDGYVRVTGRIKDQINRAGEKIAAPEIEAQLRQHPAVDDAAVIAIPDPELGEKSCAVILTASTLSLAELHDFLQCQGVAQYKKPDLLHLVRQWPLTPVGKIDKTKLVQLVTKENG